MRALRFLSGPLRYAALCTAGLSLIAGACVPEDADDNGGTPIIDPVKWQAGTEPDDTPPGQDQPAPDEPGIDDPAPADGEPMLKLVFEGDFEDRSPDDGLASQTPTIHKIGVQRLELLSSPDDDDPVVVFDLAPGFVMVDLHERTEVLSIPMADLPDGTFTNFRVVVTHTEVEVEARLHDVPVLDQVDTTLHAVYGLGEVDTDELTLSKGEVFVTVDVFGQEYTTPGSWDVPYPEPAPDGWVEDAGDETWITFHVEPEITSSSEVPCDATYVAKFFVAEGFRWQDTKGPGYANGKWDLHASFPPVAEPVLRMGANDWELVLESIGGYMP